jgi:N6-adenosine-specific RNA methylase IME4
MEKWGFKYKGLFVWVKPGLGTGSYWRWSTEFLLLGVRGSCAFADKSLSSWGQFGRGKHSEKPQEIRSMIESASPGKRLELFGRKPADGWLVWGNEIPRADFAANVDSFLPNGDNKGRVPTDFGGLKAA